MKISVLVCLQCFRVLFRPLKQLLPTLICSIEMFTKLASKSELQKWIQRCQVCSTRHLIWQWRRIYIFVQHEFCSRHWANSLLGKSVQNDKLSLILGPFSNWLSLVSVGLLLIKVSPIVTLVLAFVWPLLLEQISFSISYAFIHQQCNSWSRTRHTHCFHLLQKTE